MTAQLGVTEIEVMVFCVVARTAIVHSLQTRTVKERWVDGGVLGAVSRCRARGSRGVAGLLESWNTGRSAMGLVP